MKAELTIELLRALSERPDYTIDEFAERLDIHRKTAAEYLHKFEAAGVMLRRGVRIVANRGIAPHLFHFNLDIRRSML